MIFKIDISMEVICLILGPMLASQPCLHAF